MREPPNIPIERLRACLWEQYAIAAVTLEFLPRGLDYRAGVYRAISEHGTAYLLKATSRPLYEPSCLVPRYLSEQRIAAVVAPVPTKRAALWTTLTEWTVIVYPFLDGDTSFMGMTPAQWKEVGVIFQRVHQVQLAPKSPAGFASLRKETFDPAAYMRWVRDFETEQLHGPPHDDSEPARMLRASWVTHQSTIEAVVSALETLAAMLRQRAFPYVICHADLHPANLLRDAAGQVFVLDWDEVMLAPKERDFIFIREPYADAFWDGYGQRAIDWAALTYFCWERVVQDVIECARDVIFRNDLGEGAKADAAQLFEELFAPGSSVDAAYAAATHLPDDLRIPKVG